MRDSMPAVLVAAMGLCACDADLGFGLRTGTRDCPGVPGVQGEAPSAGERDWQALDTVLLVTVDTLNARILLGNERGWDVAPTISAFLDDAAVLPNTLTPRGLTAPALSSLLTATYPRNHGVRSNDSDLEPSGTMLTERFQQAGWLTLGYAANRCYLLDRGIDERVCTSSDEAPEIGDLEERDQILVEGLGERLDQLDPQEPVFVWLHLIQPHKPYKLVDEYYPLFHPEPYDGQLDPSDTSQADDIALGLESFDSGDQAHLDAWYATQVRRTDDHIATVFDKLRELDRWDDALVVFGADHGEELGQHNDYFFHNCSPYTSVLGVVWAFRAPARQLAPAWLDSWVGMTDMAPTIAELTGAFDWEGRTCGRSLVDDLLTGEQAEAPLFFERGRGTGGVVLGDHKLHISAHGDFDGCTPFNERGGAYAGEVLELYDLAADPHEADNLAPSEPPELDELWDLVCDWVQAEDWASGDEDGNSLVQLCTEGR